MSTMKRNYQRLFVTWSEQHATEEQISKQLKDEGLLEQDIPEVLLEYKKKCCADRQSKGFVLMAIGSFIGFLSAALTMVDLWPEARGILLYGVTGLGVCLAFLGAYLVFE